MSDFEQFSAWVKENMRANTVISNPEWWAKKLWNIAIASMQGDAKPVAEIKNREVGYHYIHWHTLLQQLPVGTKLFTYPPSASAEISRLQKELEEARKDAERYRWLRSGGKDLCGEVIIYGYLPQELDETIDAALTQSKGGAE